MGGEGDVEHEGPGTRGKLRLEGLGVQSKCHKSEDNLKESRGQHWKTDERETEIRKENYDQKDGETLSNAINSSRNSRGQIDETTKLLANNTTEQWRMVNALTKNKLCKLLRTTNLKPQWVMR